MNIRFVGLISLVAIIALNGGCALAMPEAASRPVRKKLIATGWDSPDPVTFRQHLAEFERYPFDGTVIKPTRVTADGKTVAASFAFSREHWRESEFQQAVADLRTATPVTATDNFLLLNANPGDVDWFDDAGWAEITEHWRLLARVAKQGGLRGIAFDSEPYTPPFQMFNYSSQSKHSQHSFDEYAAKARERGRAIMRAVAIEYPDITILAYRLLSDLLNQPRGKGGDKDLLANFRYGLMPSFLNGWFDVMPRSVRIVEGNEYSYGYNKEVDFSKSYADLKNNCWQFVTEANQAKFQRCWRVGQAIYLDAYCEPKSAHNYITQQKGTTIGAFEANTISALRWSDEYVWVYGEKGLWWPSRAKYAAWPARLPGVDTALSEAKSVVNQRR